jgi:hypothetical protein
MDLIGLLTVLRDICLFRAGPQDLPGAPRLAVQLVAALVALGVAGVWLQGAHIDQLPLRVALMLGFVLVPAWLLLRWRGLDSRFVQTVSALAGVGVLYNILALPIVMAISGRSAELGRDPGLATLAWVLLALTLWRVLVAGHIWHHALDLRPATGAMIALALFTLQLLLAHALFGGAG